MKCPNCFTLNTAQDEVCYTCQTPLGRKRGWGGDDSPNAAPGWSYVFAGMCAIIPLLTLGGCGPVLLGFGGASICLGLARMRRLPVVLRVLGCMAITGGAWIMFAALVGAVLRLSR